jgi:hypothetical protein
VKGVTGARFKGKDLQEWTKEKILLTYSNNIYRINIDRIASFPEYPKGVRG